MLRLMKTVNAFIQAINWGVYTLEVITLSLQKFLTGYITIRQPLNKNWMNNNFYVTTYMLLLSFQYITKWFTKYIKNYVEMAGVSALLCLSSASIHYI